jgi:GAF domain-containing protein
VSEPPQQSHRSSPEQRLGEPPVHALSHSHLDATEVALRAGTLALSQELTESEPFEAVLTDIARITTRAVFGADGAGVTLLEAHRSSTIVASDPFVREIDTIQYSIGQGPCITAIADDIGVRSGSLFRDKRWPKFASRVGNLGVNSARSVMSLPLRVPGHVIGSLNVYAHAEDAFAGDSMRLGEEFASAAAVAVRNLHTLVLARRYAEELETALKSRPTIDQAIGIIRSRTGADAAEAFDTLRTMSQRENRKVSVIAEELVDQSTNRARARHVHQ